MLAMVVRAANGSRSEKAATITTRQDATQRRIVCDRYMMVAPRKVESACEAARVPADLAHIIYCPVGSHCALWILHNVEKSIPVALTCKVITLPAHYPCPACLVKTYCLLQRWFFTVLLQNPDCCSLQSSL